MSAAPLADGTFGPECTSACFGGHHPDCPHAGGPGRDAPVDPVGPPPGAPGGGPNRAEQVRLAVFWGAVAAAATARARTLTADLDVQARTEYERDGSAPTWRIPGVGTVPLALTQDRVDVADDAAYTAYVARRYPSEVETVTRVRGAFDERLRKQLAKQGEPLCDDEGTVIPGLVFRAGGQPRGITLRTSAAAKAGAAAAAETYLDAMPPPPIDLDH